MWKSHFSNEKTEAHPTLGICPQLHVTDEAPFYWVSPTPQEILHDRTSSRIITNQEAALLSWFKELGESNNKQIDSKKQK